MTYDDVLGVMATDDVLGVMAACIDDLFGVMNEKYAEGLDGMGYDISDMFSSMCLHHVVRMEFLSSNFEEDKVCNKLKSHIDKLFRDCSEIRESIKREIESDESIQVTTEYLGYVE